MIDGYSNILRIPSTFYSHVSLDPFRVEVDISQWEQKARIWRNSEASQSL